MGYSANTRQANNRTRSAGPPYSRLIRYTIWVIKLDIFLSISDFCFLGRRQIYLREVFEIIGKYSAAACTRSGAFLEQVITTSGQLGHGGNDYGGKTNVFVRFVDVL